MKKYLVDVYIPPISRHFDVYLPAGKKIGEATALLIGIIESLSGGAYKGTEDSVLLSANGGVPLNRNDTVHDAGVRNSSRLVLI